MPLKIPGYRIIKPIAEGGMASVYLAVQESLGRRVVLKLLRKFDDVFQSARFVNEGRIIASLNHRNIITIHDIGVIGERHYISMEFLEGGDLELRIIEGISVDAALDLVETIGGCLDFVHRKNIIHRDIKPANILFYSDGTPVLTDFGVAKQQEVDARLTKDGTTLGSPYYISPEQAECKPVDGRSDIYSLGIILYEMLTGNKPYKGESDIQIIISHLSDPIPSLPPELSRYQELVDRMIAKSPDERFSTAAEMLEYIREIRVSGRQSAAHGKISGLTRSGSGSVARSDNVQDARLSFRNFNAAFLDNSRILLAGALTALLVIALGFGGINPTSVAEAFQAVTGTGASTGTGEIVQSASLHVDGEATTRHDQYLLKAKVARQKLRFATPENDSAYYYYQLVLNEDPHNEEALKGVEEIGEIYADLVEWALSILQHEKARDYLDTGLKVDPGNKRLQEYAHSSAFE
jgi:serine/threonine-protein kinase PpkA